MQIFQILIGGTNFRKSLQKNKPLYPSIKASKKGSSGFNIKKLHIVNEK